MRHCCNDGALGETLERRSCKCQTKVLSMEGERDRITHLECNEAAVVFAVAERDLKQARMSRLVRGFRQAWVTIGEMARVRGRGEHRRWSRHNG